MSELYVLKFVLNKQKCFLSVKLKSYPEICWQLSFVSNKK